VINVNQITQNIGKQETTQAGEQREYAERQLRVASATNDLFTDLSIIFPAMMPMIAKNHPQNPSEHLGKLKKEWSTELMESGLGPADLEIGLKAARKSISEFLPKCSVFIDWCKGGGIDKELINRAFVEYQNRGVEKFKETKIVSTGQAVKTTVGNQYSTGEMLEVSRRLGNPNYFEGGIDAFKYCYLEVMKESAGGIVFELPKLLSHKTGSNKNRTAEDKERIKNSAGCQDFFKQFKRGVE
jgi:hypothetical protein